MSTWIWVIIVIVAALAASIGLFKLSSSRNWLATEGKVIASSVEEIRQTNQMLINEGASNFEYKVNVKYEYSVDGQSYTGDVVTAGLPNVFDSQSDAENIVAQYSNDKTIELFYDPSKPQNSALITAKSVPITGFVIMFLMIVAIAGAIIFIVKSGILSD